jgi:hypothetical protein
MAAHPLSAPAPRPGKSVSLALYIGAAITGALLSAPATHAQTVSVNSGSLGAAGNGVNASGVVVRAPGAIAAGGDFAAYYGGGTTTTPVNTTVPYNPALNPSSTSPFTIEFWANPTLDITDGSGPAPVFNRVSTGDRSGWVFFQRSAVQGWNFAMYNGVGSTVGLQLTGGTYTPGVWTHVVVVYNGSVPTMYVNGVNTGASASGTGYNASTSATFSIGSYDTGANSFSGAVDETAFYSSALSAAQIQAHFNAASSLTPGAYSSLVVADGAVEYLRNIPEPTSLAMLGLAGGLLGLRRQRSSVKR